jgi:CHAT domain-containing protein
MRGLAVYFLILLYLSGMAQKNGQTAITEKSIIDQLSSFNQGNDYQSLNQYFPKYIEQLQKHYDNEDYEAVKSGYLRIIEKPLYANISDSLKASTLMIYGLALSANQQYQESLDIYEDITQKYPSVLNRNIPLQVRLYIELSYNHSSMGNQKKDIISVEKAIDLMESNFDKIKVMDYIAAYNNLFYYYGEYEDFAGIKRTFQKFNTFYLSQFKKPTNTKEYFYAKRVYRKMQVNVATVNEDLELANKLLQQIKNEISQSPANEKAADIDYYLSCITLLCDYYNYYSDNHIEGIRLGKMYLSEAIKYKDAFSMVLAHSKLANQYREMKAYEKAIYHVNASLSAYDFPPTSMSKFGLETMKAMNFSSLAKHDSAIAIMNKNIDALIEIHTGKKTPLLQVDEQKLLDLNNNRYVNIFISSALIFNEAFKQTRQQSYIQKSEKLTKLASILFNEFYRKGAFTPTLNNLHKKIVESYFFIALEKYKNNPAYAIQMISTIEANASIHLAKEFEQKLLQSNTPIGLLKNEVDVLQEQKAFWVSEQVKNGKQKNYAEKLKAIDIRLNALNQQIQSLNKGFVDLTLKDYSIANVMKQLKHDEAILKYYVTFDHVYKAYITHDHICIALLGNKIDIEQQVNQFVNALKKPNQAIGTNAKALYQLLLKGDLTKVLTIIPDHFLNYLPFESLQNPNTNQYFVSQSNLTYNASIALWYLHNKQKQTNTSVKLATFAPEYNNTTYNNTLFTNLPYATTEAKSIVNLFEGKAFIGPQATKTNFLIQNKSYGVLHCSMHSVLYDNDFNQSYLLFANEQPMYFNELYSKAIPAEMVVLSACNTGAGKLVEGEGIMSLSRAFTYAGVKSTVVSLWQVPDKETSEIMLLFYEQLKKGLSKHIALANAKQEFIKANPLKTHPYFWSGFILIGNNDQIVEATPWMMYVIFVMAFLVIGMLVYLKRKKTR